MFAKAVESAVSNYDEMATLALKTIWSPSHPNLYLKNQGRYTSEGYHAYWQSVDAAVKFWDRTLSEILIKKQRKNSFRLTNVRLDFRLTNNHQNNRYHRQLLC